MTVTIPATVTNLASAFYGCTNLEEVTLEHAYSDLQDGTVTMTNAFQGCTSLEKIICHNSPTINKNVYHAWRVTSDNNTASVQCFDRQGNALFLDENNEPQDIEVDLGRGSNLVLEQTTNELSFGDISDNDVIKMMKTARAITNKSSALDPENRNFVLWGNSSDSFKTNLKLEGQVIDDTATVQNRTWSSQKIVEELSNVLYNGTKKDSVKFTLTGTTLNIDFD